MQSVGILHRRTPIAMMFFSFGDGLRAQYFAHSTIN
jgi:hypothetical protein